MITDVSDRSWRSCLSFAFASTLCLLAPLFVFLSANHYDLLVQEVLLLVLVAVIVGGAVFLFASRNWKIVTTAVLWFCVIIATTFLINGISLILLTVIAVLAALAIWRLQQNAATIVLVFAAVHVFSTLVLHFISASPSSSLATLSEHQATPANATLPPVVHLMLDEFSGLHGLPEEIPETRKIATELTDFYTNFGFVLSSHAYSQYFETNNSIPNLVNFTSSSIRRTNLKRVGTEYALEKNAYFSQLIQKGYTLNILQSEYLDFCNTPDAPVANCATYQANTIKAIEDIDIPAMQKARFIKNSLVDSSLTVRKIRRRYNNARQQSGLQIPAWPTGNSHTGPLASVAALSELETSLRDLAPGEAYFAHLLLPHYPYILNADCTVKTKVRDWLNRVPFSVTRPTGEQNTSDSRSARYSAYAAQLECTQSLLEKLFAAIHSSGQWENAIVIIHGDHGSRIVREHPLASNWTNMTPDDFRDAYSTFFAVKSSGSTGRIDADPRPIQSLLAEIWEIDSPGIESGQVYLRSLENAELTEIPLAGFGGILDEVTQGTGAAN